MPKKQTDKILDYVDVMEILFRGLADHTTVDGVSSLTLIAMYLEHQADAFDIDDDGRKSAVELRAMAQRLYIMDGAVASSKGYDYNPLTENPR